MKDGTIELAGKIAARLAMARRRLVMRQQRLSEMTSAVASDEAMIARLEQLMIDQKAILVAEAKAE